MGLRREGGGDPYLDGYPLPKGRAGSRGVERQHLGAVNFFWGKKVGQSTSN